MQNEKLHNDAAYCQSLNTKVNLILVRKVNTQILKLKIAYLAPDSLISFLCVDSVNVKGELQSAFV